MATRAKSRRTRAKSRGRSTTRRSAAKRATTKRATAKRAASRGRTKRASAKRTTTRSRTATSRRTTTKRKTAAKRRAAPRSRATAKRRTAARGRAGMALVNAAMAIREKTESQPQPRDAIELLKQDHREVEALYKEFEQAEDSREKSQIAWKICTALTVHAEIEEQIFYPTARRAISDPDLLDEATVEHASAKQLIAEIESMTPRDKLFDAKVKVLVEYVKHHVKEEEEELFPKVRDAGVDLAALGRKLSQRKMAMLSQLSGRA